LAAAILRAVASRYASWRALTNSDAEGRRAEFLRSAPLHQLADALGKALHALELKRAVQHPRRLSLRLE
jgi:hypothetical protein